MSESFDRSQTTDVAKLHALGIGQEDKTWTSAPSGRSFGGVSGLHVGRTTSRSAFRVPQFSHREAGSSVGTRTCPDRSDVTVCWTQAVRYPIGAPSVEKLDGTLRSP